MHTTYTIYCLIDPRNNKPYYVGASWNKYSLSNRLARHIAHANTDRHVKYTKETLISLRHKIVYELQQINLQPIIMALFVITVENVDYLEQSAYNYLVKCGFALYQEKTRFYYNKRFKHGSIR